MLLALLLACSPVIAEPAGPPTVAAIGDSLSSGYGPNTQPEWPATLPSDWFVVNYSYAGAKVLPNLYREEWSGVGPLSDSQYGGARDVRFRVVVVLGGTNDCVAGANSSTIAKGLTAILSEAAAQGALAVPVTIPPNKGATGFTWTSGIDSCRLAINEYLRTWARQHGAPYVDADALLRDPADAQQLASWADAGDHAHLSPAAAARLGLEVQAIIRSHL